MNLTAEDLSYQIRARFLVDSISFSVATGQWLAIVGPNGAGKTTLLRLLLGFLKPTAGVAALGGDPLPRLSRREVARRIAFVPQDETVAFGFKVEEIVAMGRTPHLGRLTPLSEKDREVVTRACEDADVACLSDRVVARLSSGERQRVLLARAFAQQTPILALDEPTAHLDLYHESTLLEHVHRRKQEGLTVLSVLHDLNLAATYADHVLLLDRSKLVAHGPPADVLTAKQIEKVFRVPVAVTHSDHDKPTIIRDFRLHD